MFSRELSQPRSSRIAKLAAIAPLKLEHVERLLRVEVALAVVFVD
jgi:hypothetical protein